MLSRPLFRRPAAALLIAPLPGPAWAALEPVHLWAVYALIVLAVIVVIVRLLREALFDRADEQPVRPDAHVRHPQARYDASQASRKSPANRRVA